MTDEVELTVSKQRVLDAAEEMFMEHGYAAITLRDLAERLDIRQASLYYHFPDGKEQLYVEMAERAFQTHSEGMRGEMDAAGDDLRSQLLAIADWFAQHRPINVIGMMYADLPALSRERAQRLAQTAYEALFFPCAMPLWRLSAAESARHQPGDAGGFLPGADGRHHVQPDAAGFRGARRDG